MRTRKLGIYIGLLAIIVGATPYITGYLVEKKFYDVVKVISEMDATDIKVIQYDRGWRQSFAQTAVTLKNEQSERLIANLPNLNASKKEQLNEEGITLLLDHTIYHGPFVQVKEGSWQGWRLALATLHSKVLLAEKTKEFLESLFGQTQLIVINGEITIQGVVKVHAEAPALKIDQPNFSLLWNGLTEDWQLSRDMKHLTSDTISPGLIMQMGTVRVTFEELSCHYDIDKVADGFWLGKINGAVKSVAFSDSETSENNFSLADLKLNSDTHLTSQLIDGSTKLSIQSIEYAGRQVNDLLLDLSIKNIDLGFMQHFIKASNIRGIENQQQNYQLLENFMKQIPELLKNRPVFGLDNLSFTIDKKDVKAHGSLAVGGENATDINNLEALRNSLSSSGKVEVTKDLLLEMVTQYFTDTIISGNQVASQNNQPTVPDDKIASTAKEKADSYISLLLQGHYLIDNQTIYSTEWNYDKGELKINGQPSQGLAQFPLQPPASTSTPESTVAPSVPTVPSATSQ